MLRLMRLMIFGDGHYHTWNTVGTFNLVKTNGRQYGFLRELSCKICGKIKFSKFVNKGT